MSVLADALIARIKAEPSHFSELADRHRDVPWPDFLRAWGQVRGLPELKRDEDGHYLFAEANPPANE